MALRMLSLFSGGGGLDLGLEAAGFRVALCVENDADCRKTLQQNRPRAWPLHETGDVFDLTPTALLKLGVRKRSLSLLAGGPPCQPFSKSSYWHNGASQRFEDPRAATIKALLDVAGWTLPRVILIENVPGILEKPDALRMIRAKLAHINRVNRTNYKLNVVRLNAADYGAPQKRERVFILAERTGKKFVLPDPTHGPQRSSRYISAWDAIGGIRMGNAPALKGRWAALLPSIPEGSNYLWHTPRGGGRPLFGWRSRYWNFLYKLSKSEPAPTVVASPGPSTGPFHWDNRQLSDSELARLQSFPLSWRFKGSDVARRRQIGNAVPPLVAEVIGREIRRQFFGQQVRRKLKLAIPMRARIPKASPISRVPTRFRSLEDDHDDHPGTGLGPRARERH